MNLRYVMLALAVSAAVSANASSYKEVISEEWEEWKMLHSKEYDGEYEDSFRMKVFMDNKITIARHNALAAQDKKSYTMKMNQYGDLLHHEFGIRNGHNYLQKKTSSEGITHIEAANVHFPEEVDWRKHGAVTEVKDQGQCGSCWAFSTTGALEGQHFRKTGKLIPLSEQQLVDCNTKNSGCHGGWMDWAFTYIKENGGIDTEGSYKYNATEGICHDHDTNVGATDKGYADVQKNEDALKAAVATVGPISVAIDAGQIGFQFYDEGIYDEEECSTKRLNHAVLVVGYGTEFKFDLFGFYGHHFWIVKNSWGPNWGDEGYLRMSRNKDNQCGIASMASYPLV